MTFLVSTQNAGCIIERRHAGCLEHSDETLSRVLRGAGPHTLGRVMEDEGCRPEREEGDQSASGTLGLGLPHLSVCNPDRREAGLGTLGTSEWHLRHALGFESRGPGSRTAISVLGSLSAESPRVRFIAGHLTGDPWPGGRSGSLRRLVDPALTRLENSTLGDCRMVEGDSRAMGPSHRLEAEGEEARSRRGGGDRWRRKLRRSQRQTP